jgi:VWFA-related protein
MCRPGSVAPLAAAALFFLGALCPGSSAQVETKSFMTQAGDTLVVQNDYGKIQVHAWESSLLEVKIRKNSQGQALIRIAAQKSGSRIFIYAFFSGTGEESVDLEIKAPAFLNAILSGANPEIDIQGLQGFVRAQTFTGPVYAEDLPASVSLISDSGDLYFRSIVQPRGDARLETNSGNVTCDLAQKLNLRCWLRAGGGIFWENEPAVKGLSLEKQIGSFGPLFYAASIKGNVTVNLKDVVVQQAPPPPAPLASEGTATGVRTEGKSAGEPAEVPDQRPKLSHPAPSPRKPPGAPGQQAEPDPPAPAAEMPPPSRPVGEIRTTPQPEGPYSLKIQVDSVLLNVSVRDRQTNHSIPNLRKQDFAVHENGALQQIEQLDSGEAPFDLLLLLDVSGSTKSYINLMRQASVDFIRQLKENDRVAIATFNSNVTLIQDFTGSKETAYRAIQRIESGGGTAFYDALMACIDDFMTGVEGRSAIVVFTDGVDNQLAGNRSAGSRIPFGQLYRRIQEIDPIIYTIFLDTERQMGNIGTGPSTGGVIDILGTVLGRGRYPTRRMPVPSSPTGGGGSPEAYDEAREQLMIIAEQTGGRMYSPNRIGDLSRVYAEIAEDLRIQYLLSYTSTNTARDGTWRAISVQVMDRPDFAVRTRKGYFARTDKPRR